MTVSNSKIHKEKGIDDDIKTTMEHSSKSRLDISTTKRHPESSVLSFKQLLYSFIFHFLFSLLYLVRSIKFCVIFSVVISLDRE